MHLAAWLSVLLPVPLSIIAAATCMHVHFQPMISIDQAGCGVQCQGNILAEPLYLAASILSAYSLVLVLKLLRFGSEVLAL